MTTLSPSPSSTSDHLLLWTSAGFDDKENQSPDLKPPMTPVTDIDTQIQEAEREIRRLSARLDNLRTKKAERVAPSKLFETKKTDRVVSAMFLEPKKGFLTPDAKVAANFAKNLDRSAATKKTHEESQASRRRRFSLGPMEIDKWRTPKLRGIQEEEVGSADETKKALLTTDAKMVVGLAKNLDGSAVIKKIEQSPASRRRGMSLGPMELQNGVRLAAVERTPVRLVQRGGYLGIPKLGAIQEENVGNAVERGMYLSAKSGSWTAKPPDHLKKSALKRIEESPASARDRRRGLSLGPMEIQSTIRLEAAEGTPLTSVACRRKWGIPKLGGVREEKVSNAGERVLCLSAEPRSSVDKAPDGLKKVVAVSPASTASARIQRRGPSLGPSEIATAGFRAHSKIQEFKGEKWEEDKRGRSASASPKSRAAAKFSDLRKGIGTVGGNKSFEVEVPSKILKPKGLFQEVRSSLPSMLPSKGGKARVVASRYSLATTASSRRKWSLPEPWKLAITCRADDKHSLSLGESSANGGSVRSPVWIELPKIKATGRMKEKSPRNSGCVKRARDLIGKISYFDHQALVF